MFPKFTLVLGGARSGKSQFAEKLVLSAGKPCLYLATAQALDPEMQARISRHQSERGDEWRTLEATTNVAHALRAETGDETVLLDCATLWLSNQMLEGHDIEQAQRDLIAALRQCPASVVVVSNEVGHGIVPDNAIARQFRDAQGTLNQRLAAVANLVVFVTAGLAQVLKGDLPGANE